MTIPRFDHVIDGALVAPGSGEYMNVEKPATGEVMTQAACGAGRILNASNPLAMLHQIAPEKIAAIASRISAATNPPSSRWHRAHAPCPLASTNQTKK